MNPVYNLKETIIFKIIRRIVYFLLAHRIIRDFNFETPLQAVKTKVIIKSFNIQFIKGWYFTRYPHLLEKYRSYFQKKYALPRSVYKNNPIYKRIQSIDINTYAVVGIHIRRGDYKLYLDGKFYYTDDVYLKKMEEVETELERKYNKKVFFIIFSNENISIKPLQNRIISKNTWYIDQFLMMCCDYVIGPPSSFTGWATYLGEVPLYYIDDPTKRLYLENFSIRGFHAV